MIQTVLKRDGRIVEFNREKIVTAIRKAMMQTELGENQELGLHIAEHIAAKGKSQMTVEEIQDAVEIELMKSKRKDVAQKYITYRNQRSIARKAKTRDMFLEIINIKSNDVTRENANMNADTPAGMMMKFASETTKPFVDDYLLSEETRQAVKNNYLHIHDKDYYPTKSLTCVQHPLDHILKNGFSAGHGESRPAKRIETASILGCISLETAQNEMHGGQAIPAFDFYLAPYVRASYIEEVKTLEELTGEDLKHLYEADMTSVYVGYEKATSPDNRLGLSFAYTDGNTDFSDVNGTGDIKRYEASIYDTLTIGSHYFDFVGRFGQVENDFDVTNQIGTLRTTGSFDQKYAALSVEYGYNLKDANNVFIEPQIQVQAAYLDGYTYKTERNMKVDADSDVSIIGRAGIRAGKTFESSDLMGELYARADVLHQFTEGQDAKFMDSEQSMKVNWGDTDTWSTFGVGGFMNVKDNLLLQVDVERTVGGKTSDTWLVSGRLNYLF